MRSDEGILLLHVAISDIGRSLIGSGFNHAFAITYYILPSVLGRHVFGVHKDHDYALVVVQDPS